MPARSIAGSNPPGRTGSLAVTVLADRRPPVSLRRAQPSVVAHVDGAVVLADTPEARLAALIQGIFRDRGRTLNDPGTAEAFALSIEGVLLLIDGMLIKGHLEKDAHEMLSGQLMAMMRIPSVL